MKTREFYGDAVYNTTLKEMDAIYPRCLKTKCDSYYHTCRHYCQLADSDDADPNAAWCTRRGGTPGDGDIT
jgi:hypothetical protein